MNSLTVDVEQLTDLPEALFELAALAKAKRRFVQRCEKAIREEIEVFDWLERHQIKPSFGFEQELICVQFTGDGPLLAEFWQILRRAGYQTTSRPTKGDTSYYGWWEKPQSATIALSFSSSVCRRVQKGTRTVTKEEPIFETVCGESLEIAEDSHSEQQDDPRLPAAPSDEAIPF
jgi:hypothetical protein